MRTRWAFVAAAFAGASTLLALVAAIRWSDGEGAAALADWIATVATVLLLGATVALVAYATHAVPTPVAVAAVVLLFAVGVVGSAALLYLPYFAALAAGLAVAAGEPLPAPDPDDDRLTRPLPSPRD